jgi:hypothetical protein
MAKITENTKVVEVVTKKEVKDGYIVHLNQEELDYILVLLGNTNPFGSKYNGITMPYDLYRDLSKFRTDKTSYYSMKLTPR